METTGCKACAHGPEGGEEGGGTECKALGPGSGVEARGSKRLELVCSGLRSTDEVQWLRGLLYEF